MMDEIRKSIGSILYERVTSPLYGAFLFSWIACNWEIIYLTFFISENTIAINKIDYILQHYMGLSNLLLLPIAYTIILVAIIPFISNGAYWLSFKFHQWRVDKKHEIEKKQLLTIKQSIQLRGKIMNQEESFKNLLKEKGTELKILKQDNRQLREEIGNQEESFKNLLKEKDTELKILKQDNQKLNENNQNLQKDLRLKPSSKKDKRDNLTIDAKYEDEYQKLKTNRKLYSSFKRIIDLIYSKEFLKHSLGDRIIQYFEANNIIVPLGTAGMYNFSAKGKYFWQRYTNDNPDDYR